MTTPPAPAAAPMLSAFTSDKFKFWSFVSMVLLVFVHGYNIDIRYMWAGTTPNEPLNITTFTEYFISNGLLRFRIPMLFVISGFLYALHDSRPNGERVRKRVRSLLVPYFLWSGLYLVLFYLFELIPGVRAAIAASHVAQVDQEGAKVLVHDYPWWGFLARWVLAPLPYQLWFLRVLFFYNLAYPLIRRWVLGERSQRIFFPVVAVLWFLSANLFLMEAEGLLFFSLGVWLQKTGFDINQPKAWLRPLAWGVAFVSLAALKTWLAFKGPAYLGQAVYPTLIVLHKLTIASGLVTAWYGLDGLVTWCMARPWFVWLSGFSFIIYAVHAPLVAIAIDPFYELLDHCHGYRLLSFVALPLLIIVLAIGLGAALRRVAPRAYGLLTGGRGLG